GLVSADGEQARARALNCGRPGLACQFELAARKRDSLGRVEQAGEVDRIATTIRIRLSDRRAQRAGAAVVDVADGQGRKQRAALEPHEPRPQPPSSTSAGSLPTTLLLSRSKATHDVHLSPRDE